jgi:hypothetical protein
MRHSLHVTVTACVALSAVAMAALTSCAKPQALPRATDARPRWSVQHIQTGGIGGGHFDTTLDDDGTLHVCDSTGPAPSDKVTAADALVRRLRAHGAFFPLVRPTRALGAAMPFTSRRS